MQLVWLCDDMYAQLTHAAKEEAYLAIAVYWTTSELCAKYGQQDTKGMFQFIPASKVIYCDV